MGFNSIRDIVDNSYEAGKWNYSNFRKVPAIATTLGLWHDLSGAPGYPKANFYVSVEMTASVLNSTDGLWHDGSGRVTTDGQ